MMTSQEVMESIYPSFCWGKHTRMRILLKKAFLIESQQQKVMIVHKDQTYFTRSI